MRHVEVNHPFTCQLGTTIMGEESFSQTIFEIMDYKGEIQGACGPPSPPYR
jgi:hypothetical protein